METPINGVGSHLKRTRAMRDFVHRTCPLLNDSRPHFSCKRRARPRDENAPISAGTRCAPEPRTTILHLGLKVGTNAFQSVSQTIGASGGILRWAAWRAAVPSAASGGRLFGRR